MTALVLGLLLASDARPGAPLPEANAYVQGLLARERQREEALDRYTYDETETRTELDGEGRVRQSRSRLYRVFYVKGRPVRRLMARDGRPLDEASRLSEERRVSDKVRRFEAGPPASEPLGLPLSVILDRYAFTALGREVVGGQPALVMSFAPRPGKRGLAHDNVLRSLSGRIWVDEAEGAIVRVEVKNSSVIKVALGLGATVATATLALDFARADGEMWLPRRLEAAAAGRLLVFKGFRTRLVSTYDHYQRFLTETEDHTKATSPPGPN